MKWSRKFLTLSPADQRLLIKAGLFVVVFRLALWILPFQMVRRLSHRARHDSARSKESVRWSPERIAWAVATVSRPVPAATCLTQALATHLLFTQQGFPADLRIGVAKSQNGSLKAHAWVESQGQVVIGGSESLSEFTPLPPLKENA